MIAELIVIAVILTIVASMYLKGTVIKAFLLFMNAIIASTVALAFFETLGKLIIGYGYGGEWVLVISFAAIFIIVLILLLTIAEKLIPIEIHFGDLPDRIWRSVIAAVAGFIIAGVLLITVNLSPLQEKWPYERFSGSSKSIRPSEPDKSLILNADGFVAGFVSWISQGSMSSKKSMAVFHPDMISELSLNRIRQEKSNSIICGSIAIRVKEMRIAAAQQLMSSSDNNQPLNSPSGTKTVIVSTELRNLPVKDGGALFAIDTGTVTFTMGQVRLLCKPAVSANNLQGSSKIVYPIGFLASETTVDCKSITEEVKLTGADFPDSTKTLDFVFNIPADTAPVILQFKLNAVTETGRIKKAEVEAPQPEAAPAAK